MIESTLMYGLLVWGGTFLENAKFKKLCSLQCKIIKNLFKTHCNNESNTNALFKQTNILKLEDLYKVRVCTTMYKIINENYAPFILERLNTLTHERRTERDTRSDIVYSVPFPRVNTVKVNFIYNAVKIWNELPSELRNSNSSVGLKNQLTKKFITNYNASN